MSASSDERKRIEEKLPHELLKELYLNSRVSIKELERKLGISHHTLSKRLKECEDKYDLRYTLDINTDLLGFSEPRIIAVKFQEIIPDIALLKKVFDRDSFVQNAYLATGDFDLILHVIASDQPSYIRWLFELRVGFSDYKPLIKIVTLNDVAEGFMPIKVSLIRKSTKINDSEKILLTKLVENSRFRIKDLSEETGLSQMKIIYLINNLYKRGIIRKFTTCIQNPDKYIWLFFTISLIPNERHKPELQTLLVDELIRGEDKRNVATDYSVVYDTSGHFDSVLFCSFKSGIELDWHGPNLFSRLWKTEYPRFEKAILTSLITGIWPFNKNDYVWWNNLVSRDHTKMAKIHVFK